MKKNFKLLIGAVLIALGIIAFVMSGEVTAYGSHIENNKYGGDAYTGIQNAAADTGNNVRELSHTIEEVYENNMIFTGIFMCSMGCLFILYDLVNRKKEVKESVSFI